GVSRLQPEALRKACRGRGRISERARADAGQSQCGWIRRFPASRTEHERGREAAKSSSGTDRIGRRNRNNNPGENELRDQIPIPSSLALSRTASTTPYWAAMPSPSGARKLLAS